MAGEYRHIKLYEKEMFELKEIKRLEMDNELMRGFSRLQKGSENSCVKINIFHTGHRIHGVFTIDKTAV